MPAPKRTVPPFKLIPEPMENDTRSPRFSQSADEFNTRHQLGGRPEFIEPEEDIPKCSFGKPMTFYAQLDSISEEFMLADRGMIYVFVCLDCFEVEAVLQSC